MATINISVDYPIEDGTNLTFTAPCNCTAVTGLKVTYPVVTETTSTTTTKVFAFKDAHNNNLSSTNNLFVQNAVIKVILDVTNSNAYIQNSDTNAYLEGKFSGLSSDISTLNSGLSTTNNNISSINNSISTINSKIDDLWYKPGDVVDISYMTISGVVSSGGKRLYGWIPLAKPVKNTVDSIVNFLPKSGGKITARGVKGYILQDFDITGDTTGVSYTLRAYPNGVNFQMDRSTAFENITNNTPIQIALYNVQLKFD